MEGPVPQLAGAIVSTLLPSGASYGQREEVSRGDCPVVITGGRAETLTTSAPPRRMGGGEDVPALVYWL